MYESDIELWFKCNKERNDDTEVAKNGATGGHHQKTDELTGKMIDFSTFIKSKLSASEVLNVYNKNVREAELSFVEEEIKDADIENLNAQKNFDWLEILLMAIFILLGFVSYKLHHTWYHT